MRETPKTRLTLLLPTAMTHTRSSCHTGVFPPKPSPFLHLPAPSSRPASQSRPFAQEPSQPREVPVVVQYLIGFQTPPFFCSAKKAPWLEKGQKAVAEQKSLLWDWAVGWGWDEHSARLVQTGARGWAYREHPHGPGSSWGSTPGLEGPVWLFQGSRIPQPSLHPSFHCKQQQSSSAVWAWDNAPWISGPSVPSCTGARLSPQPASLLLFPFFVVVARSFFWFCFFFFFSFCPY